MRKSNYAVVITLIFAAIWVAIMASLNPVPFEVNMAVSFVVWVLLFLPCLTAFSRADKKRRMLDAMEAVARNTAQRQS